MLYDDMYSHDSNALGHTSQVGSLLPVLIQVLTLSVDLNVKACTQCLPVCTKPTLNVNAGINVGLNFKTQGISFLSQWVSIVTF
jgi:hypothetical protein